MAQQQQWAVRLRRNEPSSPPLQDALIEAILSTADDDAAPDGWIGRQMGRGGGEIGAVTLQKHASPDYCYPLSYFCPSLPAFGFDLRSRHRQRRCYSIFVPE
eukprot:COSAG05_NODE_979_length_6321_cov_1.843780_4_plen_102_part_00